MFSSQQLLSQLISPKADGVQAPSFDTLPADLSSTLNPEPLNFDGIANKSKKILEKKFLPGSIFCIVWKELELEKTGQGRFINHAVMVQDLETV